MKRKAAQALKKQDCNADQSRIESRTEGVQEDRIYHQRFQKHLAEFRWLYMELYQNASMFDQLCSELYQIYKSRSRNLKKLDLMREENPDWFRKSNVLGMMMYVDNFAGNLKELKKKIPYIESCHVNYLHLMPLLESPEGRSDGGYAVSDFRKVRQDLGTMEDLADLAEECHKKNISLCLDFVMNHTSEDHEWAKRAASGDGEYMSRYFFFDNDVIPAMYEKTVPQVFPATAPGNFTWLPKARHFVMTSFYPYQWDLNYQNPVVFNEMMYHFLYLANQGIDIMRIDAVPYIWKQIGTDCRNLPQVHTIVRMLRLITEIVCPGVVLLGEVVMEPSKVLPYFGTLEKPECHMLYHVTAMAAIWNSVATRDVRLLKRQLDIISSLPGDHTFLNYLRCHDDIGWGLDYGILKSWGMKEIPHKKYLNDFFTGSTEGSFSRGVLYNEDPVTQDARFCGTTASMCGIEKAGFCRNQEEMDQAIDLDIMLHAFMFFLPGIPVLYSGDEIGQVNDYTYREDCQKAPDSRFIHRGRFDWTLTEKIAETGTVQNRIFQRLKQLEEIRQGEELFDASIPVRTLESWDDSVLCLVKENEQEKIIGIFNFSESDKTAWIHEEDGKYIDLLENETCMAAEVHLGGHSFFWLKRDCICV